MSENTQSAAWNGVSGRAWVAHADHFDDMLEPFGGAVLEQLSLHPGDRVLDVGCGTGATTIAIARLVAPTTTVGVDISAPMLAAARRRCVDAGAANIEFRQVDMQDTEFEADSFDVAFSRFGVMFFPDPARAFGNIRRGLVAGGRLGFVCFQGPFDNPMILGPVLAAAEHVDLLPPPGPTEPGPFSLADPQRVRDLLDEAGFVEVTIGAGPNVGDLGSADDLIAVARRALEQNPGIAPGLAAANPTARRSAIEAAAEVMSTHVVEGRVVMAAACWLVLARAGSDQLDVV